MKIIPTTLILFRKFLILKHKMKIKLLSSHIRTSTRFASKGNSTIKKTPEKVDHKSKKIFKKIQNQKAVLKPIQIKETPKEAVLILLTRKDPNLAFLFTNQVIQSLQQIAKKYFIQICPVISEAHIKKSYEKLQKLNKIVKFILVKQHGEQNGSVVFQEKKIREIVCEDLMPGISKTLQRILLHSCHSGKEGGEAQALSKIFPNIEVLAPKHSVYGRHYFLQIDENENLEVIQYAISTNTVSTLIYKNGTSIPMRNCAKIMPWTSCLSRGIAKMKKNSPKN
jgi:hypothetical protein